MSITSEIVRLGTLRDTIRDKLIAAGIISNASAKLDECATAIDGMTVNSKVSKVLDSSTTSVVIPKGYHKAAGTVSVMTEEKTLELTSGDAVVTPDSGKVLKKVTVNGPASYADTTQFASAITQDDENTYFSVPNAGWYNTESKIAAKNSNLSSKPDFAYEPIYEGIYTTDIHTITVTSGRHYMIILRGSYGYECDFENLIMENVTIEKKIFKSSNNPACIIWFKANSNSITISGVSKTYAVFFVSELSGAHEYVKNFTSITYVPKGYDYNTYTIPCNKYAMVISMGYQGGQSLTINISGKSYCQNGFKAIKAYANHGGWNGYGYAHLIVEADNDFEVVLNQCNNNLIYLS